MSVPKITESCYQLMFQTGAAYARRYMSQAVGPAGERLYPAMPEAMLDDLIAARTGIPVPQVDRDATLKAMPEAGKAILLEQEKLFIKAMRGVFPVLPGEKIIDETVSLLSADFGAAPMGSPVYTRATDAGGLTVVSASNYVDAASGHLTHVDVRSMDGADVGVRAAPFAASAVALGAMAAENDGTMTSAGAALSLVQELLTAVGPEGEVVAAGISLLEFLFGGNDQSQLPEEINQLVVQDFANDHVKTDLTTILTYSQWLAEAMKPPTDAPKSADDRAAFEAAKAAWQEYVNNACDPSQPLLQAISNLQHGTYTSDPPYSVLGLPAYLLGAALHLTFERTKLLFATDGKTFKDEQTNYIINVAQDYLTYINATLGIINSAFSDRLNGITQPTYGTYSYGTAWKGGVSYSDYNYVYIADPAYQTFPQQRSAVPQSYAGKIYLINNDVVWMQNMPTGCCASTDQAPLMANGAAWRATYVAHLNDQLEQKYNASTVQRQNIADTAAQLQKVIETFTQIMSQGQNA